MGAQRGEGLIHVDRSGLGQDTLGLLNEDPAVQCVLKLLRDNVVVVDGSFLQYPAQVVVVTSDHGMIHSPHALRRDLTHDPVLAAGVSLLAGEPRAPQAWCEPGAAEDVVATWREELGEDAVVRTREEAVEAGWFGPVREGYAERVGEVVVAMLGQATVLDSRLLRPEVLALIGHHGSVTDAETAIPLLVGQA